VIASAVVEVGDPGDEEREQSMDVERVDREPRTLYGLREVVPLGEMTEFFGRAFASTAAELSKQGSFPAGAPIALYHGAPTATIDVTAGFPAAHPVTPTSTVVVATLPGGSAVETIHVGPYDTLADTYDRLAAWMTEHALTPADDMWEEYLVGPDAESDPAKWRTRIVFPLR
jgi:effector-binding domain-containing protein